MNILTSQQVNINIDPQISHVSVFQVVAFHSAQSLKKNHSHNEHGPFSRSLAQYNVLK